MTEQVRIQVTIAAPVDDVWHALRDRDTLHQWHGWQYEDGTGLSGEIDVIYHADDVHADAGSHRLEVAGGDVFTLEPDPAGTRLTITRAQPTDPDWDAYYDDVTEGWVTFVQQLKFLLERRPGAARRTLHFGASATSGDLVDVGLPEGSAYETDLAGEPATGTVWFRSDRQAGFTVDQWGPGLLVVGGIAPTDARPDGVAQAVLTTYGMSDSAFAALEQRWTSWWKQRTE